MCEKIYSVLNNEFSNNQYTLHAFYKFDIMKTITLTLPEMVDIDEKEVRTMLAAKFYEQGKLSLGQAAELAGYSKRTFMDILGDYDVSLFNFSEQELDNDIANAKSYHI